MSTFQVVVVQLQNPRKHPNADTLSIAQVLGEYPVIYRTDDFGEGALLAYVPIDAIVPDTPEWAFLAGHRRIKAKRLRGIFSMGLLVRAPADAKAGDDVTERMGIVKYEPPESASMGGENERDPGYLPTYTEIEALRRYPDSLQAGEEVVLTEKLHGANARYVYRDDRLWVGSHHNIKRQHPDILWWKVALQLELEKRLSAAPNYVFYGEVYGNVQDLKYDVKGYALRVFDVMDGQTFKYLDFDDAQKLVAQVGLDFVPVLYRGPWRNDLRALSNGQSTIAKNVREGFVVKPVVERWDERIGRVILKLHGEDYLLRKGE